MNKDVTYQVLQEVVNYGVREFIVCAGVRNVSFVEALRLEENLSVFYWSEERSGAFFALGRSRSSQLPVAIIVTSGTAVGELLPATMEAFHTHVPLVLITADRPASYRNCGGPQCADQIEILGSYAPFFQDIGENQPCDLSSWDRQRPAHLNVCLEEPQYQPKFKPQSIIIPKESASSSSHKKENPNRHLIENFLTKVQKPLVIVSGLVNETHEIVISFLEKLGAPLFLEGVSGIREEPRLQHLRVYRTNKLLESAKKCGYGIDGVLRLGSVPTHRAWRDLEYLENEVSVCSLSDLPFSGLSWNKHLIPQSILATLNEYSPKTNFDYLAIAEWLQVEATFNKLLLQLFEEEPFAEPSLIHSLSKIIPYQSHVYLGNSMPIREWDMCAGNEYSEFHMTASRGLSGIDGQISTFLGLSQTHRENWAIIGDLTALYDMAGFWVLPQMKVMTLTVVIMNNSGGKIFEHILPIQEMLNAHQLNFEPLARMWGLDYFRWETIPASSPTTKPRLIEIVPNLEATQRFWKKLDQFNLNFDFSNAKE